MVGEGAVSARVTPSRAAALLGLISLAILPACHSPGTKPSLDQLFTDLESKNLQTAGEARMALIALGEPAVPRLMDMLVTGTPQRQRIAANLLWAMGPKAAGAVSVLTEMAATPETDLRLTALMSLKNLGPAAEPAVPVLIKALHDRNPEIRRSAVEALAAIGPGAKEALPALKRMAQLTSWSAAENAIRKIQGH